MPPFDKCNAQKFPRAREHLLARQCPNGLSGDMQNKFHFRILCRPPLGRPPTLPPALFPVPLLYPALLLSALSYSSSRCPALLSCCPCTALVLHMSRTLAAIEDDDDDSPDVAQTPSPSTLWPFGTAATTMKPINCSKKAASSAAAAASHCRKSPALCANFD